MDDLAGLITPGRTDQLPVFRAQRLLVQSLTADVAELQGRLATGDPSQFWHSAAQRAYRERVAEIVHDLGIVVNFLDEAQDQLGQNIWQLESEQ
jgi:HPt (histidine-containing phosphotransfer) domain-containing protein